MNKQDKHELIREVVLLSKSNIDLLNIEVLRIFDKIGKLMKRHHRICEDYCNTPITDEEYTKRITTTENKIKELIKPFGLFVSFHHDPRGLTTKITTTEGEYMNSAFYWIFRL